LTDTGCHGFGKIHANSEHPREEAGDKHLLKKIKDETGNYHHSE
jgi:hypothetical protein